MEDFFKSIGCAYLKNISLAPYTTFDIGGNAQYLVFPATVEQVIRIFAFAKKRRFPCRILGRGANLLISDSGVSGIVLSTKSLNSIRVLGDTIEAGAGVPLGMLLSLCQKNELQGLEDLVGIPATVGGALAMNAGANGVEISSAVIRISFYDCASNTVFSLSPEEFAFRYRHSLCHEREGIVLSATFRFQKGNKDTIFQKTKQIAAMRKEKQPLAYHSAGSVFLRPFPYYAPRLIEEAGLKGKAVGNAQISTKHAGFIINLGGAKAKDVNELLCFAQNCVFEKFGIKLQPEIIFWGDFSR